MASAARTGGRRTGARGALGGGLGGACRRLAGETASNTPGLRAVTGDYVPFWEVTKDGLDWAMEKAGLDDPELRERLLALYWELAPYREAPRCLAELKAAGLRTTAILSNGSPDMLEGAVGKFRPQDVARHGDLGGRRAHFQAGPKGLRPMWAKAWAWHRGGALRLRERLGRVFGGGLRLPHDLGEPHRGHRWTG